MSLLKKESDLDRNRLYFHGSANGSISKFRAPSPRFPLFVTADIDYANEYLRAAHVKGRAKFNESDDSGKVYLFDLDFENINLFDGTNDEDLEKLKQWWPPYVTDQLKEDKYSIWSIFKHMLKPLRAFMYNDEWHRDFSRWSEYVSSLKDFEDEQGLEKYCAGIAFLDSMYGVYLLDLYTSDADDDDILYALIKLFNLTLVHEGFNAFKNHETIRETNVESDYAIGLLSPDCVKSLSPVPLDQEAVKAAIEDLGTKKDYAMSNQKLMQRIVDVCRESE